MRRRIWLSLLLVVVVAISASWLLNSYVFQLSEAGFKLYFLQNNMLLVSDMDILSYNWTSQEIGITPDASERLIELGDSLYHFTGFMMKLDGEELYRGVFRTFSMSALPSPPHIAILFLSILFPAQTENYRALRMFYPTYHSSSGQSAHNAKIWNHFDKTNKLEY